MRPVLNKDDFYKRWLEDEFGNRLRGWTSVESLMADSYSGLVNIRSTKADCKAMRYDVPKDLVLDAIKDLGGPISEYRFNELAPDSSLLIQGELYEDHRGWWLLYSLEQMKMRVALEFNSRTVQGLTAKLIMQHFCCPSSLESLRALIDLYPYHVIEFGVYEKTLGTIPNRNTIIWEVRKY